MASSSSKVDYEVTVECENLLRIAHANTSYCEDHKQEGKRIFHQLIIRYSFLLETKSVVHVISFKVWRSLNFVFVILLFNNGFKVLQFFRCQSLEDESSQKIIDKFEPLAASTAAQRNQYRAMIKVAWRLVLFILYCKLNTLLFFACLKLYY